MKKQLRQAPPRWATRFLEWYCRRELLEDLQGDLNEYFARNVKTKGVRRAKIVYMLDVLKFFRSYTIRKPEFINLLIQWIMIGSYIKTSTRSILRHKLFSTINIVGLSVSMSVGLLMIAFVSDLSSYDDFHEKKDRIYRVITTDHYDVDVATTSVKAGKRIKEEVAGIEEVTLLRRGFGGDAKIGENMVPIGGLWADESFFKLFTLPLLQGDPATALKEPYSLVLTESSAKKLFGNMMALGKSVKFDTTHYIVTGVLKDIPKFSHMRFDALASFATVELMKPDTDGGFLDWGSVFMNYVYVLLPEHSDLSVLQANIDRLVAEENAQPNANKVILSLQSLKNISLGKSLRNQIGPQPASMAVWVLSGLAFIVIISACFNYTNLSIARSLKRSREVGIRKVIGALKGHVLSQFVTESVMISLLALLFSFVMFLLLREQFLGLDAFLERIVSLRLSPRIVFYFILLALAVGILAGLLPALFFSRIKAVQVLKDASSLQLFRHVNMRKALIVVQYIFSLIFITSTLIGYKQYKSFLEFDLGFATENILNIQLQGNESELLIKELSEIPEVNGISKSLLVMSLGNVYTEHMKYKNMNDSSRVWLNIVDEHYLPLHKFTLLAGKNFAARNDSAPESEAIVNEQFLKHYGVRENPAAALGEVIVVKNKELTIVGVVKDFHYETVEDKIAPMVFEHFTSTSYGYVNVRLATQDLPAAMEKIETAWKKIDSIHPINAKFYDEQIAQAYKVFSMMIKVIGFLAFLAVCIASMGLFGMVVFTTETRLKEISIRKVLGANEGTLVYILSKGFLLLISIAALIALPVTYIFFNSVVLSNFVYHEPIGMGELLSGALGVMLLAVLMIGSQTMKVARSNPADVLRNE